MRETPTDTRGAKQGLKVRIAVSVTLLALLGILGNGASAAHAETPWWHLTTGARPAYLHAGARKPAVPGVPGEPEVQEIVVPLKTIEGEPEQGGVVIKVNGVGIAGPAKGRFVTEPFAGIFGEPEFLPINEAKVQAALEEPYGTGKVTVKEVATSGSIKLTVSSPGRGAPIEIGPLEEGFPVPTVTVLKPGTAETPEIPAVPDGELYATAENLGDADTNGKVQFKDIIPSNLKAISVSGTKPDAHGSFGNRDPLSCALEEKGGVQIGTCTLEEPLAPYDQIEMRIGVNVEPGAVTGEQNEVSISGGGAPPSAPLRRPVTISSARVPFGLETNEIVLEEEGGQPTTQAGAHPFQLTSTIVLNQLADNNPVLGANKPEVTVPALAKDLNVKLPPGLIGNANALPQCTTAQFFRVNFNEDQEDNECPPDTAVGVAVTTVHEPTTVGTVTVTEPIFNLEPRVGEPARFGFYVVIANSPVSIDTSVRTGGDYGVTVNVQNITQTAAFLSSETTFWGVPGDPRHDSQRGWGCLYEARNFNPHLPCIPAAEAHPKPFLSMPTACATVLSTSIDIDPWSAPGTFLDIPGGFEPAGALTGCNHLQFAPEIKVKPDGQEASKPTGLTVDVHVPQEVNENASGYASSNVRNITVAFPEGVVLNPAAADGLQACSEGQVGFLGGRGAQEEFLFTPTLPEAFCPDASKIGTVTIKSPLLPRGQNVEGDLYLANPAPNGEGGENQFNSLIASYIVAQDPVSGVLVKLPGSVSLDPSTGRITATFENNPQLAFEDAEIHLFGGERAPFATPSHCGTYRTDATFTPWSGTGAVKSSSSFDVTSGPGGSACPPAALPFVPTLAAGTTSNSAGSFSPLSTTISREDGNQNIQKVQLHMPPGLSGILKGVPLCAEAQANAGTCGAGSLIGHTTVSVGLGGDPFTVVGGEVFLTEKIAGSPDDAPFGLSIVNPAVAGPFNLGKVIVRATIEVDPHTAQLTVTTTEIPHILKGIPLQIKHVNVTVDRPGFTFNPTDCNPQQLTGTIGAVEGASSPVAVSFQVTNCAALKFAPKFSVSTKGKNSKANGATLIAKLSYPNAVQGTQSNITRVKVDLPKQLPSRLTTLQKACTNAQFEHNPANCPVASKIGFAKVTTPLLPVPLEGPAIFVSHGGEAFPSLTMVLQGYGVTVDLVGTTFISKTGVTSTTFKTVPDVPFNTFQLTLPQGKFSALAANVPIKARYSLCGQNLVMPTEFLAQNSAKINQSTKIAVTGCQKAVKKKKGKKIKKKKSTNGKGSK
jgi:hypothetical protein